MAILVSSGVYVVVGPFLTVLSLLAATRAGQPEADILGINIVFGWFAFAVPLSLLVIATALLGEACAQRVRRTTGKLLVVSLVSAALLFGTAALLSALGGAFLTDWSSMSLTLLPGWLLAGAGPRFWAWIAELKAAAAELDTEPAEAARELP